MPTVTTMATKDFTRKRERLTFTIDDDQFEAAPAVPGEILIQFAGLYDQANGAKGLGETYKLLMTVLEMVLLPDSYERIHKRVSDQAQPIEYGQLDEIIVWLMEAYGLRPTQLPPPSSTGQPSPVSGASSTESTDPEASTSSTSLPTPS